MVGDNEEDRKDEDKDRWKMRKGKDRQGKDRDRQGRQIWTNDKYGQMDWDDKMEKDLRMYNLNSWVIGHDEGNRIS